MVVYVGQYHFPKVMESIQSRSHKLKYWWILCSQLNHYHGLVHRRQIYSSWKPLLFYVKGDRLKFSTSANMNSSTLRLSGNLTNTSSTVFPTLHNPNNIYRAKYTKLLSYLQNPRGSTQLYPKNIEFIVAKLIFIFSCVLSINSFIAANAQVRSVTMTLILQQQVIMVVTKKTFF